MAHNLRTTCSFPGFASACASLPGHLEPANTERDGGRSRRFALANSETVCVTGAPPTRCVSKVSARDDPTIAGCCGWDSASTRMLDVFEADDDRQIRDLMELAALARDPRLRIIRSISSRACRPKRS